MNEHNAINLATGQTKYVGIFDDMPAGFVYISDVSSSSFITLIKMLRFDNNEMRKIIESVASANCLSSVQSMAEDYLNLL